MSIISHYRTFKKTGNLSSIDTLSLYFHYLYLRLKYGIGIRDYFTNELYKKGESSSRYWEKSHTYIHSWRKVIKTFAPNRSKTWLFFHYLDYQITKLYCSGADAMDYFRYELYRLTPSARREFITEGYLPKMVGILNGNEETAELKDIFRDKAKFNKFFSEYITREWLVNIDIDETSFVTKILDLKSVICKPLNEGGGKGIFKRTINKIEEAKKLFKEINGQAYIIEEIINQHHVIAKICPTSVNTIRVFSVIDNKKPRVISACLRIGNGINNTDNYSSGGYVAEIDIIDGIVSSRAVNQYGQSIYKHPHSGVPIMGTIIPQWNEIVKTVEAAHRKIPALGYIGWDVVVCEDNSITFIEGNTTSGVELQQHAPLQGKMPLYKPIINKWKYERKK